MQFINPTREQFKAIYGLPSSQAVSMLNLLKFHEHARYQEGDVEAAAPLISGREAYEKYSAAAEATFRKVGGSQIWIGQPRSVFIGSNEESWDLAFVAYYPSPQAFAEMVKSENYQNAARHRTAAVADSRLIVCNDLLAGNSFAPLEYLI